MVRYDFNTVYEEETKKEKVCCENRFADNIFEEI